MADFDIPGLPDLKMELTRMSSSPKKNQRSPILRDLIRELYTEIRMVRIQGHGWATVAEIIRKKTKIPCSAPSVKKFFEEIDLEWEKETGVAALDHKSVKKRKYTRKDTAE